VKQSLWIATAAPRDDGEKAPRDDGEKAPRDDEEKGVAL